MRCPQCEKVVAFADPEAEVHSVEVDTQRFLLRSNIRLLLRCAECAIELREADLTVEQRFTHLCPPRTIMSASATDPACNVELVRSGEAEADTRFDHKTRQLFYTFTLDVELKCRGCGETFPVQARGEQPGSEFSDLH